MYRTMNQTTNRITKNLTRGAGILLPISSLPSPYGIGTLGAEAYKFINQLVQANQRYWQVLPVGPTSIGDSPYQSFSSYAGNPYFIDLDRLCEEGLLEKRELQAIKWGSDKEHVDYGALWNSRYGVLRQAYEKFKRVDTETADKISYQIFCTKQASWLDHYALFMACKKEFHNSSWLEWENDIRTREPNAITKYTKKLEDEIRYWKFIQYKFYQQWYQLRTYANDKGIQIIGDMPIYVAMDSADVWAEPEQFQLDDQLKPVNVSGAPPDVFSDEGQKWGNPLYDWERMEKDGFAWWKRRMMSAAHLYDVVRIDHFIGIVRYYMIPAHKNAKEGYFAKGPGIKLLQAIEEVLGETKVIAEDLGVLIPEVEEVLREAGYPGMRILELAFDGNRHHPYLPHNYEKNCVVYGGTHDNDTLEGYYDTLTDANLAYALQYTGVTKREELVDGVIKMAYASIADTVIFQAQDLLRLGSSARMNFVTPPRQNWTWRMKKGALTSERLDSLYKWADLYGRGLDE